MSEPVAEQLQAIGRYLIATCPRPAQPDPERPWLRQHSAAPCAACRDLQAALGLEVARVTAGGLP